MARGPYRNDRRAQQEPNNISSVMKANQKFRIGQRVRLSQTAWRKGIRGNGIGATGTVTAFDNYRVWVKVDSAPERPHLYHMNYWEAHP